MAEVSPAQLSTPAIVPAKVVKRGRPKGTGAAVGKHPQPTHPPYRTMIKAALVSLNDKKGSSRAAILKYICQNYRVGEQISLVNSRLRAALKRCVETGFLKHTKGIGASGSFLLGNVLHEHQKAAKKHSKKKSKVAHAEKPAKPSVHVKVAGKAKSAVKGRPAKKHSKGVKKAAKLPKIAKSTKAPKKRIAAPKPKVA